MQFYYGIDNLFFYFKKYTLVFLISIIGISVYANQTPIKHQTSLTAISSPSILYENNGEVPNYNHISSWYGADPKITYINSINGKDYIAGIFTYDWWDSTKTIESNTLKLVLLDKDSSDSNIVKYACNFDKNDFDNGINSISITSYSNESIAIVYSNLYDNQIYLKMYDVTNIPPYTQNTNIPNCSNDNQSILLETSSKINPNITGFVPSIAYIPPASESSQGNNKLVMVTQNNLMPENFYICVFNMDVDISHGKCSYKDKSGPFVGLYPSITYINSGIYKGKVAVLYEDYNLHLNLSIIDISSGFAVNIINWTLNTLGQAPSVTYIGNNKFEIAYVGEHDNDMLWSQTVTLLDEKNISSSISMGYGNGQGEYPSIVAISPNLVGSVHMGGTNSGGAGENLYYQTLYPQ